MPLHTLGSSSEGASDLTTTTAEDPDGGQRQSIILPISGVHSSFFPFVENKEEATILQFPQNEETTKKLVLNGIKNAKHNFINTIKAGNHRDHDEVMRISNFLIHYINKNYTAFQNWAKANHFEENMQLGEIYFETAYQLFIKIKNVDGVYHAKQADFQTSIPKWLGTHLGWFDFSPLKNKRVAHLDCYPTFKFDQDFTAWEPIDKLITQNRLIANTRSQIRQAL
jgi:hypothetical protein